MVVIVVKEVLLTLMIFIVDAIVRRTLRLMIEWGVLATAVNIEFSVVLLGRSVPAQDPLVGLFDSSIVMVKVADGLIEVVLDSVIAADWLLVAMICVS